MTFKTTLKGMLLILALFQTSQATAQLRDEETEDVIRRYVGRDARALSSVEQAKLDACIAPKDAQGKPVYVPNYEPYVKAEGDCSRLLDQKVEFMAEQSGVTLDCYYVKELSSIYGVAQNLCKYVSRETGRASCFSADLIRRGSGIQIMKNEIAAGIGGSCY